MALSAAVASTLRTSAAARVRLRQFGDNALQFELLAWIRDPELRGRTLDDLHRGVYTRFAAEQIEIAFPQQDLHVRTVPEGWLSTRASSGPGDTSDGSAGGGRGEVRPPGES